MLGTETRLIMSFAYKRCRGAIQSVKIRPGADRGPDHELLFIEFRLMLKIVWETTRQFTYYHNHIPCEYTVKGRNRLQALGLVDSLKNYGQGLATSHRR